MLVEVIRRAYLASLVPVVLNAILNEHQVVADIIAFVSKGDFPRSRLGEKQRGKILASWVTRKMRTIAQFGIRDPDGADSQITEVAEPRSGGPSSTRNSSMLGAGSLRHMDGSSVLAAEKRKLQQQEQQRQQERYTSLPTGISEMPAEYDNDSIEEAGPAEHEYGSDDTPTEAHNGHSELEDNQRDGSPVEISAGYYQHGDDRQFRQDWDAANRAIEASETDYYTDKPLPQRPNPTIELPSVSGPDRLIREDGSRSRPSQQPGGLRAVNRDEDDEEEWPQEAIMHMNLASSDADKRSSRGSGYGYGTAM